MSDYLGNLVTRTISQATVVRPQLPSLFEPSIASGQVRSELEFEQEAFSESSLATQRTEAAAPNPPSNPTPRQSSLGEPEPPPIMHRARIPASSPPPILTPEQPVSDKPQPKVAKQDSETQASTLAPHQSVVRGPKPIIPQLSHTKGILSAVKGPEPSPEDIGQRPARKGRKSRSTPVQAEIRV